MKSSAKPEKSFRTSAHPNAEFEARVLDWAPLVEGLLADVKRGEAVAVMSARFHNGLVEAMQQVAQAIDVRQVVLTGGCFQNGYLLERARARLEEDGFRVYWPQRVPPNDGGIAFGQVIGAAGRVLAASLETSNHGAIPSVNRDL